MEERVAPLAGAWIEIFRNISRQKQKTVAPLAGAWIEILVWVASGSSPYRRSPRGSVD